MAQHRCKVPEPPPDTGRWLGTYGDMVTLLMAFFVMLFAVSDTNARKFEDFVRGLAGPFDNQSASAGLGDGGLGELGSFNAIDSLVPAVATPPRTSDGLLDRDAIAASLDAAGSVRPHLAPPPPAAGEAADPSAATAAQLEGVRAELEQVIAGAPAGAGADLRDDERGLVVAISTDDVLFPTGSAVLSPVGVELITALAPVLRDAPNQVVVEGHTDDRPLDRGGYTNWNLSTDRAAAVVRLLGDALGVPYTRMSVAGYAEHRPIADNATEAGRTANRRVEILVVGLPPEEAAGATPAPDA
jgi:chemotaxis protein MotB